MKKSLVLVLCLAALFLCACGSDEDDVYVPTGDALVMDGEDADSVGTQEETEEQEFSLIYYATKSMNPLIATDYTNRTILSLIYQSLFIVDSDNNVEPLLCDSFQVSSDSRVWTFYIDERATFSDGTSLTIQDVLATYQYAMESGYYKARFLHVTDVSLTDDGGIAFTLSTAYEDFTLLLDVPILKASQVESEYPLGTGPYAYTTSLSGATLRRVSSWWCDSAGLSTSLAVTAESIPLVEATDAAQIRDEFEFEDVGLVCADPCSASYVDYRCDYELWDIDNGIFLYIGCNVRYVDFLSTTTLRANLTYGIDRDYIVEEYMEGYGQAATLAASPSSPYYSKSLAEKYAFDSAKFVSFLSSYDTPDEPIRLLVNSDDALRLEIARYIAETFTDFGLPMETVECDTATYQSRIVAGNYDLYLGTTRLSANMDLSAFFGYWDLSRNGISDTTIYALCLESLANSGNYYNLHETIANDGRIIPIAFYKYAVYAERGLLTDLTPARDNVFYYSVGKTMSDAQIPTDYDE